MQVMESYSSRSLQFYVESVERSTTGKQLKQIHGLLIMKLIANLEVEKLEK